MFLYVSNFEDIYIHQTKYVKELLKKFNMSDAKEMKTLMHPTAHLGLDEESTKMGRSQYRAMIGSLLYHTTFRLDIMFIVCLHAKLQKEPREFHLTVVKRIFRYLLGTPNLGLMFKRRESSRLTSYCNTDYVGDKVDKKSTSGSYHFIGGNIATWICKRQRSTALSIVEAEYMSTANYCAQLLWINNQLEDYSVVRGKFLSIVIIKLL